MATAKKTTTKKPAAKKPAVKRAPVKKTTAVAATRKPAARKATAKKQVAAARSFRPARETQSFTGFRVTKQTFYWIVLVSFIVFMQIWMLRIQMDVAQLVEQQATSQADNN